MHPLPPRRWNPGFIAMRWRHLFWILPIAGLLAGLAAGVLEQQNRKDIATGVAQLRPPPHGIVIADMIAAIESEDVLEATSLELDLPARWESDHDTSVMRLRTMISSKSVPDTSLVEVSVRGSNANESAEICKSLLEKASASMEELHGDKYPEKLEKYGANVAIVQAVLDERRDAVNKLTQRPQTLPHHSRPRPPPPPDAELSAAIGAFEEAQNALEAAKIALITEEMKSKIASKAVIIHEPPALQGSALSRKGLLSLSLFSVLGLALGTAVALAAAYLLETLIPRNQSPASTPAA